MISEDTKQVHSVRKNEIVAAYLYELDKHLEALHAGRTERMLEIREFAGLLHIHPGHLSNTIQEVTGQSSCEIYEHKIIALAKELLKDPSLTIGQIASQLTYDPSNFTKFFKAYAGLTPKQFRNSEILHSHHLI